MSGYHEIAARNGQTLRLSVASDEQSGWGDCLHIQVINDATGLPVDTYAFALTPEQAQRLLAGRETVNA